MLRSLVYQIWAANSRLYHLIQPLFRQLRDNSEGPITWSSAMLMDALRSLHHAKFDVRISIILDGWDESERDKREDIVRLLCDLTATPTGSQCNIRVMIASRLQPDLQMSLQQVRNYHCLRLQDANAPDIAAFVRRRLKHFERRLEDRHIIEDCVSHQGIVETTRLSKTFAPIEEYINSHAEGVFVWVVLVLNDISRMVGNGCVSLAELFQRVRSLPTELQGKDGFYRRMISRLSEDANQNEGMIRKGKTMMGWVAFAKRPLSIDELGDALVASASFNQRGTGDPQAAKSSIETLRFTGLEQGLVSCAGGLLEVCSYRCFLLIG